MTKDLAALKVFAEHAADADMRALYRAKIDAIENGISFEVALLKQFTPDAAPFLETAKELYSVVKLAVSKDQLIGETLDKAHAVLKKAEA